MYFRWHVFSILLRYLPHATLDCLPVKQAVQKVRFRDPEEEGRHCHVQKSWRLYPATRTNLAEDLNAQPHRCDNLRCWACAALLSECGDRHLLNRDELNRTELNGTELSWTARNWNERNGTKLNGTEPNWTELNRTERNWKEMNRNEWNWTGLNWTEVNGTELNGTKLNWT